MPNTRVEKYIAVHVDLEYDLAVVRILIFPSVFSQYTYDVAKYFQDYNLICVKPNLSLSSGFGWRTTADVKGNDEIRLQS